MNAAAPPKRARTTAGSSKESLPADELEEAAAAAEVDELTGLRC
jgi:hypothetical protein